MSSINSNSHKGHDFTYFWVLGTPLTLGGSEGLGFRVWGLGSRSYTTSPEGANNQDLGFRLKI